MKKIFFTLSLYVIAINSNGQVQLYGVTVNGGTSGGSYGIGNIFHYNPSTAILTNDHSFVYTTPRTAAKYGAFSDGGNNKLYAMSTYDGLYDKGSIFEWDPVTNVTVKKMDFDGINGAAPQSSLTLSNGKFYGMTSGGGTNNMGVIFEWDPVTNKYTKKIDFDGTNGDLGSQPSGALTLHNGKFYGMTSSGGSNNRGVIFEWDPLTNTFAKKIDFNGINGSTPYGGLTIKDGKFYGMTYYGGLNDEGAIFEWDPLANTYTKKADLNLINGTQPYGNLILNNGKFYGLTYNGGQHFKGVIFEWDPVTNIYSKKLDFNGPNGSGPNGSFAESGGKLYGITEGGGTYGKGVIFEWDPATNTYIIKINFGGNGDFPTGTLALLSSKFYGMSSEGGGVDFSNGVIFEWDPATNIYKKKLNFKTTNGSQPHCTLSVSGNKLYGITAQGGANNDGVIFEWDPLANTYVIKFDFSFFVTGALPEGAMTLHNGKFYGIAQGGAAGNTYKAGVIFEWDPVTNIYTKKIDLNESTGWNPQGSLVFYAGKFYGTTSFGTAPYARGVIFEWDPVTNIYTVKNGFDGGSNGGVPVGSLTQYGSKFYGMTSQGGANNQGVIFEWDPATNILTKKMDFNTALGLPGNFSTNSLILNGSKFYGLTHGGGTNGWGVIFEWDPVSNIYNKKIDLDGVNGGNPYGSLMLSNGKFYGMTSAGGTNGSGVIFEWDAALNSYTKLVDFNSNNGSNPYGNLVEFNSSILPIKLVSFTAMFQNTAAILHWKIATAEDGGKYALQRSTDGRSFATINEQTGDALLNQFFYVDKSLPAATYYYRLKMTDKDGKNTFSNIAVLKVDSKHQLITAYPNPVKKGETLQLNLQNDIAQKIELITMTGHIVYSSQLKVAGNFGINVPASLAAGEYLLKVVSNNISSVEKIIVR